MARTQRRNLPARRHFRGDGDASFLGFLVFFFGVPAIGFATHFWNHTTAREEEGTDFSILVFGGLAAGAALLSYIVQARKDDYAAAQVGFWFCGLAGAFGVWLLNPLEGSHPMAVAATVASFVLALASAWHWYGLQHAPSPSDNPLARLVSLNGIEELDGGVQFAASSRLSSTGFHAVILAQNCHDSPRNLVLELESSAPGLAFVPKTVIGLPPLAVVRVELPMLVREPIPRGVEVVLRPHVQGRGGARLRRWRARHHQTARTSSEQVAFLAIGVATWGGGLRFRFPPTSQTQPVTPEALAAVTTSWDGKGDVSVLTSSAG